METIQVALDADLLEATDAAARRKKVNRSTLIRQALQKHLSRFATSGTRRARPPGLSGQAPTNRRVSSLGGHCRLAVRLNRDDVHLCRFAPPDKQRPVLLLTRDSPLSRLSSVTLAPVTSTIRDVPSEVLLDVADGMKGRCAVNLHNAITISKERLGKRIATLSYPKMREVCAALQFSLGCDGPQGHRNGSANKPI